MTESELPGDDQLRGFIKDLSDHDTGNAITRGLAAKVAIDDNEERKLAALRDEWDMFLMEGRELAISVVPDDEVLLLEQSRRLYAAWTTFCKGLPQSQQAELCTEVPDIRLLYQSVANASATWEDKRNSKLGRTKKAFTRICDTLSAHSNLVSIFPTDDKYVRLVTGSLSAIAQASINHEKLADGVATTLEDLSQDMNYWNRVISENPEDRFIQRHIIELYVVVTEFLTDVFTQWSKSPWKRFIKSFDQNAFRTLFDEKRKRIQAIGNRMDQHANVALQKRIRMLINSEANYWQEWKQSRSEEQSEIEVMKTLILKLGLDVQTLLEGQRQDNQYFLSDPSQLLLTQKETMEDEIFCSKCNSTEVESATSTEIHANVPASPSGNTSRGDDSPITDAHCARQDALDVLQGIVTKFGCETKNLVHIITRALRMEVDLPIKSFIETWTNSALSNAIWIQGPHNAVYPSQNTMTAAYLVALCNNNRIPCLSFFCSLQIHTDLGHTGVTRRHLLTAMIKSLIVQLLLMPQHAGASLDIPKDDFEELAQDDVDVAVALHLLRRLHSLLPPVMYCVIDGMQELENRGDKPYTKIFFAVLKGLIALGETSDDRGVLAGRDTAMASDAGNEPTKTVKLCFVTDGYVDALAEIAQEGRLEKLTRDGDLDGTSYEN